MANHILLIVGQAWLSGLNLIMSWVLTLQNNETAESYDTELGEAFPVSFKLWFQDFPNIEIVFPWMVDRIWTKHVMYELTDLKVFQSVCKDL